MSDKIFISVGLDYSLTSPGICIKIEEKTYLYYLTEKPKLEGIMFSNDEFHIQGLTKPIWTCDQDRYLGLANIVIELFQKHGVSSYNALINIEGYSYASNVSSMFPLAENMSILKYVLWKNGYIFSSIPPTKVKKFATGKGNANKDAMYTAFLEATGLDLINILGLKSGKVGNPVSDMADAYWLARMSEQ